MSPYENAIVELFKFAGIAAAVIGTIITARRQKSTEENLATNHGMRPGEYLELIGDVVELAKQAPTKEDLQGLRHTFEEHVEEDRIRFQMIFHELEELRRVG